MNEKEKADKIYGLFLAGIPNLKGKKRSFILSEKREKTALKLHELLEILQFGEFTKKRYFESPYKENSSSDKLFTLEYFLTQDAIINFKTFHEKRIFGEPDGISSKTFLYESFLHIKNWQKENEKSYNEYWKEMRGLYPLWILDIKNMNISPYLAIFEGKSAYFDSLDELETEWFFTVQNRSVLVLKYNLCPPLHNFLETLKKKAILVLG